MRLDVGLPDEVSDSERVRRLLVGRFMCRADGDNTIQVSPLAWDYLIGMGLLVDPIGGRMAVDPEWASYRRLDNWEWLIARNRELFSDRLVDMINDVSKTVEEYTVGLSADEYRILLNYGGRDVYDFFVFDHRFGAPPRGREYRSNLRKPWHEGPRRGRPDNGLLALRRRIDRRMDRGEDVSDDLVELLRRRGLIERGLDWRGVPPQTETDD